MGTKVKVLVIEDEKSMREILKMVLEGEGYGVVTAADGYEGLQWLQKDIFDVIITDIKMPGHDGFEILGKSRELSPETLVIMITAFGNMESAVDAMKAGAYDYIYKPFKMDEIRLIVKNAADRRMLKTEVSLLKEKIKTSYEIDNIVGRSPKMQEVLSLIPKIAAGASNVLITGESGTGKDLVATAIYNMSARSDGRFVAINCAALPEGLLESEIFGHMKGSFTGAINNKQGLFEVADGGTMFLDEVADMPLNLQSKLLRAIENGTFRRVGGITDITVDVRIISASNIDMKKAVSAGRFREDLYYRLNVIPLHIPPLRERSEDIPHLIEHFMKKSAGIKRNFSGSALNLLINHEWRGNVRELENVLERIVLFVDKETITEAELPDDIRNCAAIRKHLPEIEDGIRLEETLSDVEKSYLTKALTLSSGKKTEAAKLLGISFRSLRHKLAKYGIK